MKRYIITYKYKTNFGDIYTASILISNLTELQALFIEDPKEAIVISDVWEIDL